MAANCPPSGEWLLIAALLVSIQLAQGRSEDELALISSFFSVVGSNLAFIAVTRAETPNTEVL